MSSLKVFFACVLGAFTGTLVSLQINQHFWWLGLAVGFAVGYLSYEFKRVATAVPAAWRRTIGWRPSAMTKEMCSTAFLIQFNITMTLSPIFVILFLVTSHLPLFFCAIALMASVSFASALNLLVFANIEDVQRHEMLTRHRIAAKTWNPIYVYFRLPVKAFRFIWQKKLAIAHAVGSTFVKIGRFCKELVRLVHSDLRLLCGMDAAVGAVVGYYFHSTIIGAFVGGLWGVLNFEILSVRVFKFVPRARSLFS